MTMTTDLYTAADVKRVKALLYEEQGGNCALSGVAVALSDCHTDHAHDDEQLVRGALYRPKKALKYRPSKQEQQDRRLSIEDLNARIPINLKNFTVTSRSRDPNYCSIVFDACGHSKDVIISDLGKKRPICYVCKDATLAEFAKKGGFRLLTKLLSGSNKSRYEKRLLLCENCGEFKIVNASSLRGDKILCRTCLCNYYDSLIDKGFWELVTSSNHATGHVCLGCLHCGEKSIHQVSNVKRYVPVCPHCKHDQPRESFVYSFLIENQYGKFVKIGKSNNPYLRHLGFESGSLTNNYTFLGAMKFQNEKDAYNFERQLLRKFKNYRLDKNFTSRFMSNGFTEVFSVEILTALPKTMKGEKDGQEFVYKRRNH